MLQMLGSTIQPVRNGIAIVAMCCSLVCACSQGLMHVPHNVRCIVNLSFTFAIER